VEGQLKELIGEMLLGLGQADIVYWKEVIGFKIEQRKWKRKVDTIVMAGIVILIFP
jgi:hypothetical protein